MPNLKAAPPNVRVTAVQLCVRTAEFRFTFGDDSVRAGTELAVMLNVDAAEQGPAPGSAVLPPAREPGDRVLVIFAGLDDLKRRVRAGS